MIKNITIALAGILIVYSTLFCYGGINDNTKDRTSLSAGLEYYKQGKYKDAVTELEEAIKQPFVDDMAYYCLGESLYKIGKYLEAAEALNKSITDDDADARKFYYLGCCYFDLKEYDKAERNLMIALIIEQNPFLKAKIGRDKIVHKLIVLYNEINEIEKAINLIEEKYFVGTGVPPQKIEKLKEAIGTAEMYINKNDFFSAKRYINTATVLAPSYYLPRLQLAYYYYYMNDFQKAKGALENAMEMNKNCAEAYLISALILANEGDIPKALEQAEKAKEINAYEPLVYLYTGEINKSIKNYKRAVECYKIYLDLNRRLNSYNRNKIKEEIKKLEQMVVS